MKKVAIIIPAYKTRFLDKTLSSIEAQSNHDFCVYVGDDASPNDIATIVHRYQDKMDLVYHRFEQNMGGRDLTGHWERCIALSQDEPLIWLFSDDDLMPSDGIQRLLDKWEIDQKEQPCRFYRFPLVRVDENEKVLLANSTVQPDVISGYEFLLDKLSGRISSAACEYVFSRELWNKQDGFIKFPMAWCSDDATWVKFAESASGICFLSGQPVCWRNVDGENISNSSHFNREKVLAVALFLRWISKFYPQHMNDPLLHHSLYLYLKCILSYSLHRKYDIYSLMLLCSMLKKYSLKWATRLWFTHIRHIKRLHTPKK